MAEELDVDALLDAPFKQGMVGGGGTDGGSVTEAKAGPVETEHLRREARRSRSRHDSDAYGRARRADGSPRDYGRDRDHGRYRDYERDRHYDRYDRYERRRRSGSRRRSRLKTEIRFETEIALETPARVKKAVWLEAWIGLEKRIRFEKKISVETIQIKGSRNESERDLRTVFAMQLSARLRRSDLVEFFSQAGRVRDAQIVSEKGSRRSRGVAYVEFYAAESAAQASLLSGQRLLGVPIIVQPSEAEKNRKRTTKQYTADGAPVEGPGETLVVVRELMVPVAADDVRRLFALFGTVEHCRVAPMPDVEPAVWTAYVQLGSATAARRAAERLNGLQLFGERLRVRMARKSEHEREQQHVAAAQASCVLLLKNMVDAAEETGADWRAELGEDVRGECAKFGAISRVFVDAAPDYDIYVEFVENSSADAACRSMHARWFAGRQIEASLVPPEQLQARAPPVEQ
ncbi:splicing factor [Coemansia sp. RSA 2705]|nr:splicing factor [Coemansia sp. RSA 2705]